MQVNTILLFNIAKSTRVIEKSTFEPLVVSRVYSIEFSFSQFKSEFKFVEQISSTKTESHLTQTVSN